MSAASKAVGSVGRSDLRLERYCVASRRRVSAAVSESEEDGSSSSIEGERPWTSSSEPEPDMDSSSR